MADLKISALTASSTPLAGTEVLPIVQSSATVKVAVSNLTAGRNVFMSGGTVTSGGAIRLYRPDNAIYTDQSMAAGSGGGYIFNNANGDGFKWQFAGTDQFLIDSSGNAKVSLGNLIVGTSGKGIDFSATSGTGTSELLADYEEGTFTPTVRGSTTAGTATYAAQNGSYTKVGRMVYFQIYIDWSAGTGTGNLQIASLPFTSANNTTFPSVTIGQINNIATTASNIPCANVVNNGTNIDFNQYPIGGGAVSNIAYDAAGYIICSGAYAV